MHGGRFSCIRICDGRWTPETQGTKTYREPGFAAGINLHKGFDGDDGSWNWNPGTPWSEGCVLVSGKEYQSFCEQVGLVNKGVDVDSKRFNTLSCSVIINRDLFNPNMVVGQ